LMDALYAVLDNLSNSNYLRNGISHRAEYNFLDLGLSKLFNNLIDVNTGFGASVNTNDMIGKVFLLRAYLSILLHDYSFQIRFVILIINTKQ